MSKRRFRPRQSDLAGGWGEALRFFVDHCVPAEVARWLTAAGHEAWTAWEANLAEASDAELITYAHARDAIAVTTNRDFIPVARRQRSTRVIYLAVREAEALAAMQQAVGWLDRQHLPSGRVLRVGKTRPPQVLPPLPW